MNTARLAKPLTSALNPMQSTSNILLLDLQWSLTMSFLRSATVSTQIAVFFNSSTFSLHTISAVSIKHAQINCHTVKILYIVAIKLANIKPPSTVHSFDWLISYPGILSVNLSHFPLRCFIMTLNAEVYSLLPLTVFSHIGHMIMIFISEHKCFSSHFRWHVRPPSPSTASQLQHGVKMTDTCNTVYYPFGAHRVTACTTKFNIQKFYISACRVHFCILYGCQCKHKSLRHTFTSCRLDAVFTKQYDQIFKYNSDWLSYLKG